MDNISPEVLIYIQTVKNYFEINNEAREFFLSNSDEELFYKHLTEIAQKNFKKSGTATLDREQFELLRKTILAITISKSNNYIRPIEDIDVKIEENKNIFIEYENFGKICLN
jgi:hypothetical protein